MSRINLYYPNEGNCIITDELLFKQYFLYEEIGYEGRSGAVASTTKRLINRQMQRTSSVADIETYIIQIDFDELRAIIRTGTNTCAGVLFFLFQETLQLLNIEKEAEAKELLSEAIDVQQEISLITSASDEAMQKTFIEKADKFLHKIATDKPECFTVSDVCLRALAVESGEVYRSRLALETSIQMINSCINQYIELMQMQVQQTFPAYFNKFRTDSIEYDIYIGQSITPKQEFRVE